MDKYFVYVKYGDDSHHLEAYENEQDAIDDVMSSMPAEYQIIKGQSIELGLKELNRGK